MGSCSLVLFVVTKLCLLLLAVAASRGQNKLQRELPNAFKSFQAFPHPVGVMDTDNDSVMECLSARRAEIDPKTQTATYVWSLPDSSGNKRIHVPVYHTPGDTPDATRFAVGSNDAPVEVGYVRYSDYKDCAILEMAHFGAHCTLWVSEAVRDSIPAKCLEQYADICGEGVSIYDKDMCKGADK